MEICDLGAPPIKPIFFILGPCAAESYDMVMKAASTIASLRDTHKNSFFFKSSFYKANRTRGSSYRGPGLQRGLELLWKVKQSFDLPIVTDVHEFSQISEVAEVADILQIPAFLSRQTDLIEGCARTGRSVMIKKGQFMSPQDALFAVEKAREAAPKRNSEYDDVMICERGSSFGYRDIIVDYRGISKMREAGCPVVFDASHTTQCWIDEASEAGGDIRLTPPLARAAICAGASGIFIETHPYPEQALSDKRSQFPSDEIGKLVKSLIDLDYCVNSPMFYCYGG